MKHGFAETDIMNILLRIAKKKPQQVLDAFLAGEVEKLWANRLSHGFARLDNEDNEQHIYIKGVVDGMVLYQHFFEHYNSIKDLEEKENAK